MRKRTLALLPTLLLAWMMVDGMRYGVDPACQHAGNRPQLSLYVSDAPQPKPDDRVPIGCGIILSNGGGYCPPNTQ